MKQRIRLDIFSCKQDGLAQGGFLFFLAIFAVELNANIQHRTSNIEH